MSDVVRSTIPKLIMAILGILIVIDFCFVTPTMYKDMITVIQNFVLIISAFALGLAATQLLIHHTQEVTKKTEGQWQFSLWLVLVMIVFVGVGIFLGSDSETYTWIFNNFYRPIDMTLYSLIGWLVVYAIYRTFRIRNYETLFLVIIAFITLMGNSPIGPAVWPPLGSIKSWLNTVPNTAAIRGFNIATALGAIGIALRTLYGMEEATLGG
jgi:amino acid transporter